MMLSMQKASESQSRGGTAATSDSQEADAGGAASLAVGPEPPKRGGRTWIICFDSWGNMVFYFLQLDGNETSIHGPPHKQLADLVGNESDIVGGGGATMDEAGNVTITWKSGVSHFGLAAKSAFLRMDRDQAFALRDLASIGIEHLQNTLKAISDEIGRQWQESENPHFSREKKPCSERLPEEVRSEIVHAVIHLGQNAARVYGDVALKTNYSKQIRDLKMGVAKASFGDNAAGALSKLQPTGLMQLCKNIEERSYVRELVFKDEHFILFTPEGGKAMRMLLAKCPNLKELSFIRCRITKEGIDGLCGNGALKALNCGVVSLQLIDGKGDYGHGIMKTREGRHTTGNLLLNFPQLARVHLEYLSCNMPLIPALYRYMDKQHPDVVFTSKPSLQWALEANDHPFTEEECDADLGCPPIIDQDDQDSELDSLANEISALMLQRMALR